MRFVLSLISLHGHGGHLICAKYSDPKKVRSIAWRLTFEGIIGDNVGVKFLPRTMVLGYMSLCLQFGPWRD